MESVTRIGLIHSGSKQNFIGPVAALVAALPNDVQVVERWADDDTGVLDDAVKELVEDRDVRVIVAAGGPDPALRLMKETKDLAINKPIVFTTVADPKASKLVEEKHRPGKNLTGMAGQTSELDSARLTLLSAFVGAGPGDKFGVLRFENRDHGDEQYGKLDAAAQQLRFGLKPKKVHTVSGIARAYEFFAQQGVKGVVVTADSFFNNHRAEVVAAATTIPTIYQWKEFVDAGGLMSYGPSILEAYKKAGEYVTQILQNNGDPANMPCSEPSSYAIYVNLTLARKLGISVPKTLGDYAVRAI